jgi:hypothetical protein
LVGCLDLGLRKVGTSEDDERRLAAAADARGRRAQRQDRRFWRGANHTNGFYGTTGSVSFPLAYQWGAQIDGGLASASGSGVADGAAHVFWRDPSIGLLGAYGSYERWNGTDLQNIGGISATTGRIAAEGEYYWGRWNFNGLAGVETVGINEPVPPASIPNRSFSVPDRFFDSISASYFVTDNFSLSIGHLYTFGTHFVTLGSEYGFALGGGRMAALFTEGLIGERGNNSVLGGVRIYFGQRDKTLIDRHRQDDPVRGYFGRHHWGRPDWLRRACEHTWFRATRPGACPA